MIRQTLARPAIRCVLTGSLFCAICFVTPLLASPRSSESTTSHLDSAQNAQPVIVTPKFGGQILGYAIDPSGTEGVLSESVAQ
ncbi:MAG: hypothetical protein WBD59_05770, partial [Candidatus Sulfotelmatobacter sp.]